MNRFFIIVFFSLWVGACSPINRQCVAICGGKQVRIIDMERSNGKDVREVWQWEITTPTEGLPVQYAQWLNPLDECKFVDNNSKLLLTSSHSATVLIDIKSRKEIERLIMR